MPSVYTPFSTEPLDVDDDEAASLKRQGLLRESPPEAPAPAAAQTVTTVFGAEVTVDAGEAAVLVREGLLAAEPAAPDAPDVPVPSPPVPPPAVPAPAAEAVPPKENM